MKKTIYNKIKCVAVASMGILALSSCEDFLTITPSDKTVLEEYWKSKDDVDQMVSGAYKYMEAGGMIERFIVWGEFRSDEVEKSKTITNNSLDNIAAVNMLPGNGYNSWADFYKVINTCNLVLEHSPEVMQIDPNFTQGDYDVVRAQMLALRSLCYFYLVRTFRDVPYTETAYENTDQILTGPQYAPAVVLQHCIDDLKEAEGKIYRYGTFGTGDWRNYGLFNRDAVDALLADIYLWRGSMTKNPADYQECVNYANKVIQSRDNYYNQNLSSGSGMMESSQDNPYHLIDAENVMLQIFKNGNSRESIFELQFAGTSSYSNEQLAVNYFGEKSGSSVGRLTGSQIMGSIASGANGISDYSMFFTTLDYRFWNSCYNVNNADETNFDVRKMVSAASSSGSGTITPTPEAKAESRSFGYSSTVGVNWIVYRFTDVLLMKAEALVQLADENDENALRQAYNIVKAVNDRSLYHGTTLATDSLKFADYSSKTNMEKLCLAERGRELCFEGKRWYDMVRYCYRHMEGVDINKMLYEIDPNGKSYPGLYADFVNLMARKYVNGGDAVKYKMQNEAYLYYPVQQREINANPELHQIPVYEENKSTDRQ